MLAEGFVVVYQHDGSEMDRDNFASEMQSIFDAFPDFGFRYTAIEATNAGVVLVHNLTASGTHRGEPYAFSCYDPVEASGCRVENDPAEIALHFGEDNKICKMVVRSTGDKAGPPGIYAQLEGAFPII